MRCSAALPTAVHDGLVSHLLRRDGQEDLCFALWHPSSGASRETALITEVILPDEGDRQVHGNASFNPQYVEKALGLALARGAGLAFLHSHPTASGWQAMSDDDRRAEDQLARVALGATGRPLIGLTMNGRKQLSARRWDRVGARKYEAHDLESVRVVGERLDVSFNDAVVPIPQVRRDLVRTVAAWGPHAQARLARLRIGVVGAGSVGSMVAEALARMGTENVYVMDFDRLERHNLDRQLHATRADAFLGRHKAKVLCQALERGATAANFRAAPFTHSIAEEAGFRIALDCDVLFSCVDRPLARFVLNFIAYAHLIPVVDGGIRAVARGDGDGLRRADWKVHTVGPGRECLECNKQYAPEVVAMDREGLLDDPSYLAGLPADSPLKANENVFPFSMNVASLEVLQLISLVVSGGLADPGSQGYHVIPGCLERRVADCQPRCVVEGIMGLGDDSGRTVTGRHVAAEQARQAPSARVIQRFVALADDVVSSSSRRLSRLTGRLQ